MDGPIERGVCDCPECNGGQRWTKDEIARAQTVKVVGVCRVLQEMQADALWRDEPVFEDPYAEEGFRVFLWCLMNDAVYYGAPREHFCEVTGRLQAARKGRSTVVVVEDMS